MRTLVFEGSNLSGLNSFRRTTSKFAVRFALGLPKHGRSANGTELKVHREAAVGFAPVAPKVPFRLNGVARKEGGDAKRAARAPLALQTVTEGNLCGLAFTRNTQLPTRACCCSLRHDW